MKHTFLFVAITVLAYSVGCGVSEQRHKAELEQQADRYERQLKEQQNQIATLEKQLDASHQQLSDIQNSLDHGGCVFTGHELLQPGR